MVPDMAYHRPLRRVSLRSGGGRLCAVASPSFPVERAGADCGRTGQRVCHRRPSLCDLSCPPTESHTPSCPAQLAVWVGRTMAGAMAVAGGAPATLPRPLPSMLAFSQLGFRSFPPIRGGGVSSCPRGGTRASSVGRSRLGSGGGSGRGGGGRGGGGGGGGNGGGGAGEGGGAPGGGGPSATTQQSPTSRARRQAPATLGLGAPPVATASGPPLSAGLGSPLPVPAALLTRCSGSDSAADSVGGGRLEPLADCCLRHSLGALRLGGGDSTGRDSTGDGCGGGDGGGTGVAPTLSVATWLATAASGGLAPHLDVPLAQLRQRLLVANEAGVTALHAAAAAANAESVVLLLAAANRVAAAAAALAVPDVAGDTPLHAAVRRCVGRRSVAVEGWRRDGGGGGRGVVAPTAAMAAEAAAPPPPRHVADGLVVLRLLVGAGAPLEVVNRIGLSPQELASVVGAPAAERELALVAASLRGEGVLPDAHPWCGG